MISVCKALWSHTEDTKAREIDTIFILLSLCCLLLGKHGF